MDSAWSFAGLVLYATAAAAVVWWLVADWVHQRIRPKRRCSKCWFDMRATEGLQCPDCGHRARNERALWKSRRRKAWLALATGLLIAGFGMRVWPAVDERGWPAAVPTRFAIGVLSPLEGLPWPSPEDDPVWWARAVTEPLFGDLVYERLRTDEVSPAQHDWLARRCIRGDAQRRPLAWQWRATYGELLHEIAQRDEDGQAKWREAARTLVELRFAAASGGSSAGSAPFEFEFDVGERVVLSIHIDDWGGASPWDRSYRIIGRPVESGFEPFDIVRGYDLVANAARDRPGRFDVELGRSDRQVQRVTYEIEIHEARGEGEAIGRETLCRHYLVRLPIRIVERSDDDM